ncbi:tRNA pseudouridine(55) synthase TruB [Dethiothermospora halolimnae]|uniref:tRNA pseudouridine(55) synthase TruB n=1 Tax=Dethiothermospora halolimnae TaxID=3114390 RepID=UPI003CCBD08A
MNGIINVLKPTGMTSHDVVGYIRRTINFKKVGHTGTLDPNAAGVLPICIGKATKVSQYLLDKRKVYRGELTLGKSTDTQDRYGKAIDTSDRKVEDSEIIEVFKQFNGKIKQTPPMYSAVKHKGKRLYELARKGEVVEREPREVEIYKLDIITIDNNRILFDAECSKGTYIRTLCNDIGERLGTYGYMSFLIRTQVDNFTLDNSMTLDEIKEFYESDRLKDKIIPMDFALTHFPSINLPQIAFKTIINGGKIPIEKLKDMKVPIIRDIKLRVYCDNEFIGIGKIVNYKNDIVLRMEKVLYQR